MPFCPNCGSYVSSGDNICDCGTYVCEDDYLELENITVPFLESNSSLLTSQKFIEFINREKSNGFKLSYYKAIPQQKDNDMEIIVGFSRNDSMEIKEFKYNIENDTYELYNEESRLKEAFNENNNSFEKFIILNRIVEYEKRYNFILNEVGIEYPLISFSDVNNNKIIFKYNFETHELEYEGKYVFKDYIEFSKDFKMVSTPKNYKEHIDIKSAEYKLANISEFIKLIDEIKKEGFIFTSIETSSDKDHMYVNFKKDKSYYRQYQFSFTDGSFKLINSYL
ncbi:zinc ribbon domain-containing protein [Methanobrevibacter woesei]|uniref:zinc ribbon domain-containing protein n=1 Tax=Methanobrevibacter woesei TaxID=190976 RepID=UPI0023F03919|nr:zinc ribbon domain-containing protein [Methanobrevibacter woesei]